VDSLRCVAGAEKQKPAVFAGKPGSGDIEFESKPISAFCKSPFDPRGD